MTTDEIQKMIAQMVEKKNLLSSLDKEGLYRCLPPNPPATEAEIAEAESRIGEPLAPEYRDFLKHAAGWSGIVHHVDLFGPSELGAGPLFEKGVERVGWMMEFEVLEAVGFKPDDLLPIAAPEDSIDVYTLVRRSSAHAGTVIWFRGDEIERYDDFHAYFKAMIGYNEAAIARAQAESGRR